MLGSATTRERLDTRSSSRECELGAGNETRTRDPDLGKVVLYQLSYSRVREITSREFYVHPLGSQGESRRVLGASPWLRNWYNKLSKYNSLQEIPNV